MFLKVSLNYLELLIVITKCYNRYSNGQHFTVYRFMNDFSRLRFKVRQILGAVTSIDVAD